MPKLLVVIATGEKEKALAGLMYAGNALKTDWLEDVKVIFFGPSEKLIVQDKDVANKVASVTSKGETFACKAISDRESISQELENLNIKVEYVGPIISRLIKEGYLPMVW